MKRFDVEVYKKSNATNSLVRKVIHVYACDKKAAVRKAKRQSIRVVKIVKPHKEKFVLK